MSTKLIFKRIALVTISALGFGILSSVTPASAVASSALVASVGPAGQTSLTVVGGDSSTAYAVVRLDVTVDSATGTSGLATGLQCGESITATVSQVPTTVVAKTLAANGGRISDTTTAQTAAPGTAQRSDLVMTELAASTQGSGTAGATAGASTTTWTDWSLGTAGATSTNMESSTAAGTVDGEILRAGFANAFITDGQLGCTNTYAINKDGSRQASTGVNKVSYYVSIASRLGANTFDVGAYTVQFQLTDANGAVIGTSSVKIDFVSTASKSDATLTLATAGTFIKSAALGTTDTSGNTYASVTLKNRDGGLVRTSTGTAPTLTSRMQVSTTAEPVYADTGSLVASDTGAAGYDFGNEGAGASGTLRPSDGVYGLRTTGSVAGANPSTLPNMPTIAADSARVYRFNILYGNATPITTAFTVFEASGSGLASAPATDVLVTAAGMSTADQLKKSDTDMGTTFTLPTTTTSATVKFTIQTASSAANAAGATLTVKPTWSGSYGTANVSPATSTTGTAYTTDAD